MADAKRWALARMEAAFSVTKSRMWDVVVPYAAISLSYTFVTSVAVPFVLPEGLAAIATIVLAIFWILLSAALTVGAYAEIVAPSLPIPPSSFSFDAVTAFFDRSWSELRKCLWTFYYVFEYAYLVPMLAGFLLFLAFSVAAFAGSASMMSNPFSSQAGGPVAVLSMLAFVAIMAFVAYRQLKSVFAVVHAVSTGKSDRLSFKDSLKPTEGKWWSVFWNFLVVGLVFMGTMVLFILAVEAVFWSLWLPRAVVDFIGSLPGPLFSVFITFFTYELYKDFVPAEKKVEDIFVP